MHDTYIMRVKDSWFLDELWALISNSVDSAQTLCACSKIMPFKGGEQLPMVVRGPEVVMFFTKKQRAKWKGIQKRSFSLLEVFFPLKRIIILLIDFDHCVP